MIDTDARYLYYVLPNGKAIRYGVTVGEEALVVVRRGQDRAQGGMAELDAHPEQEAPGADIPAFVGPAARTIPWARARCISTGNKDTLYRIHGTNQPEYIGTAISSGCIRMTNEDVIDLYKRIKLGTVVVVLAPTRAIPATTRRSRCWRRIRPRINITRSEF